ncbi:MAG: hypothetical protein OXG92_15460 [Chloroflexi bacterium]|nr:hypothetical protein [Chloroflexota bacterium]MCY3582124.1 hypothetical protein [Chloroflexota bacterium]MCY3717847.1 hypothetical protein [Chloroflexota bacterium]MDE2649798.1 hypothetical protein [Chloroflexota bacterium]MXV91931.1 hypothetical protein [Chloroflexota bacterium]
MRKLLRTLLAITWLLAGAQAFAQAAPAQINAALLDLGARLGENIGIDDLAQWRWQQTTFADSALGCPTVAGAGGAVIGYSFQLTHGGSLYDYRVSADSAIVILCSQSDPLATAAQVPPSPYSNSLCPAATGGPYMQSRINVGMDVLPLGASLDLRGQPALDAPILRSIPAGTVIRITSGPDCAGGYVWWLALVGGQTGYIAETGANRYLVEPKPPNPLPSREALSPQIIPFLREFARLRGNFLPEHSWSSDGLTLVVPGAAGSDSLWLYDLREPLLRPRIQSVGGQLVSLAARPGAAQAAFGGADGRLSLWAYSTAGSAPSELLYLDAHGGAVSALAFSPDGARLASAGPLAYTSSAVQRDFAAIVWDLATVAQQALLAGHRGLIRALAFSPDGAQVASGADDGMLRFWGASSGEARAVVAIGAPIVALDYSPDGRLVAVASARAAENLLLLDARTGAQVASYPLPTPGVTALDFSPDSRLLAVGAAQGLFTIWDSQRHSLLTSGGLDASIHDISFSPDGSLLAVSIDKHALLLYGAPLGSG